MCTMSGARLLSSLPTGCCRYLLEKANPIPPSPEELFLSGSITLKAYEDIRYPGKSVV